MNPTEMAPDGFQIPRWKDFRFFTANENHNLGYGSPSYNNGFSENPANIKVVSIQKRDYPDSENENTSVYGPTYI